MKNIKRGIQNNKILVEGKMYNEDEFLNLLFGNKLTGGIIRIYKDEFDLIPKNQKYLTHFNLQVSYHKKGKNYALVKILEKGYYDIENNIEKLPNLSFKDYILTKCINVKENVAYDEITEEDFKYSFPHIKNIKKLQDIIIKRYSKSMPNLSKDELLSLGVSITYLEIL